MEDPVRYALIEACVNTILMSDHAEGCPVERANISELRTKQQRAKLYARCDCHLQKCRQALIKATGNDPFAEE